MQAGPYNGVHIGIAVGNKWREGKMIPDRELGKKYELAPKEVFRYLQIGHVLKAKLSTGTMIPEASPLKARLFIEHVPKKAISLICRKIINNTPDTLVILRCK